MSARGAQLQLFSVEEVKKHNSSDDCWIILHNRVYDCTQYMKEHPGGDRVILQLAGCDATAEFEEVGHSATARHICKNLEVGVIKGAESTPDVLACGTQGSSKLLSFTAQPAFTEHLPTFCLAVGLILGGLIMVKYL